MSQLPFMSPKRDLYERKEVFLEEEESRLGAEGRVGV